MANGAQFVIEGTPRLLWYAFYLVSSAALVWFRWITPLRRALRHRLRVAEVRPEAPGVISILLTGRRMDELAATVEPGQ